MVLGLRVRVSEVGCRMNRLKVQVEGEVKLQEHQGEKSINLNFLLVPLRTKVLKYGSPKPREST